MYNRGYIYIGAAVITLGVLALIGALTGVDFCALVVPLALIAAGAYVLVRPRIAPAGGPMVREAAALTCTEGPRCRL